MELGILIGFAIVGLIFILVNWKDANRVRASQVTFLVGFTMLVPSVGGIVGKLLS
jgi:hypothetical protein